MSNNVVNLYGTYEAAAPQPNVTLVAELERLLSEAREGALVGMAATFQHAGRDVSYSFAGAVSGYAMIGGLECVKDRLLRNAMAQR